MAARMSDRSIQRKEDYLDWMHEKFCASSRAYVSAVKAALRSHRREHAAEIFERAIDVLSPDFPDPTSIDGQTQEEKGGNGNELNSLKDRIAQVERQLQEAQNERSTLESELKSVRQEAQTKCSTLESELEFVKQEAQNEKSTLESEFKSVRLEAQNVRSTLESELKSVKQEAQNERSTLESELKSFKQEAQNERSTLESELKSFKQEAQNKSSFLESQLNSALTQVSKENSANIQGLRKLQILIKQRDQAAAAAAATAAVFPPPTAPSASALSRPLKDVRQRNSFDAKIRADHSTPDIWDVQLLPGGRLLLTDWINRCVKLFDTQGQHLHTLECRSNSCRLAVLDSSSIRHTVAVTLPRCFGIDILEVNGDKVKVKRTLQMSREYWAVAAVNNLTLAVGYWPDTGIDLIDLGGQVLRQIFSLIAGDKILSKPNTEQAECNK
ncbi:baculovirus polyhedron envelope protein, pep, c terminus [Plakobranchus ocellatus]|uniref:Baculovirus polyhedron envelope protein, pep, c terminus n=1 Tax=Plakobranchus ocellatus TaxID=259542 RepID=A0AAV3ZS67_9GAST|nr:baculovirus polyhedron envelope protein, pep, c terminus [Plakobranchus ocellatus]